MSQWLQIYPGSEVRYRTEPNGDLWFLHPAWDGQPVKTGVHLTLVSFADGKVVSLGHHPMERCLELVDANAGKTRFLVEADGGA